MTRDQTRALSLAGIDAILSHPIFVSSAYRHLLESEQQVTGEDDAVTNAYLDKVAAGIPPNVSLDPKQFGDMIRKAMGERP